MAYLIIFSFLAHMIIFGKAKLNKKKGVIKLDSGNTYPYVLGNNLPGSNDFHGIEMTLPKRMSAFYLDSHHDSRFIGPRYSFDKSQRISLEGNFDKYFQLFAPKNYQILVLSILTPDIMLTILQASLEYDVEIKGRFLKIMSRHRVYEKPARENELLGIASKILKEIDQKLNSWTQQDENEARKSSLKYVNDQSLVFLGNYFRGEYVVMVATFIPAVVLFVTAYNHRGNDDTMLLVTLGFFLFPCISIYLHITSR